jgi:hypothetical protein
MFESMMKWSVGLMAVGCVLVLAATAGAVTITAGGTQFDSGGFENDPVGTNPSAASVGSWYVRELSGSNVEVYGPTSGGPGADLGDNYLMLYKGTSGNYRNITACAQMVNTAAVGTTVVAEHSLYCPSTPLEEATSIKTIFAKGANVPEDRVNWVGFGYNAGAGVVNVTYHHYGGTTPGGHMVTTNGGATNMTVAADTWLNVQHDLTVGSSLILTIDGVASDPIPIEADFQDRPVSAMHFLSNATNGHLGRFYIDGTSSSSDFVYSASRTVGGELFPGVCPRVVVADDGTWLMLRRCNADGTGTSSHTGQAFLARSDDNGETWTDEGKISNDEYDALNAEFIKYPNGHIDIFYTKYKDSATTYHTPNMVSRSIDDGDTWSTFQPAASPLNEHYGVMWQDVSVGDTTYLARYSRQVSPLDPNYTSTFSKTTDNGSTWTDVSNITTEAVDGPYGEPGLAYLGDGEFLVVLRDIDTGNTLQKRSTDWGETWVTEGYIKSDGSVNPDEDAGTNVVLHQCRMWTEDIDGNDLGYIYMQANLYPGGWPRNMYAYFSTDNGASWGFRSLLELGAHDSALVLKSNSSAKYYPGRKASEGLITCDDIDIVTPPPLPGDANGDRVVNDEDASILAAHWQMNGDFNDDGVVNDEDASILAAHWQETAEGAPVPEPGTLVLLAGALLSLLVWRRR